MKVNLILPNPQTIDVLAGSSLISEIICRVMGWGRTQYTPSLTLLMLGAVTPPDIEVNLIDERIEKLNYDEPVDLVGITVVTRSAPRAYEIAEEYHKRGVKVVMGGVHPSALPEEALQHADAVVIGEGEGVWPQLLEDFKRGHLKRIYRGQAQMNLDLLPLPRRELIKHPEMFVTTKVITATRGCLNNCSFCAAGIGLDMTYRKRSISHVLKELEQVPGPLVDFQDDNLGWDLDFTKSLMKAIIPLRIKWSGAFTPNALEDRELAKLAKKSGCYMMEVGFETLTSEGIASLRKQRTNHPARYAEIIKRTQGEGVAVWGNFIIGLDEDTKETFSQIIQFVNDNNLEFAMIFTLTPYPGCDYYKKFKNEARLLHENWTFYDMNEGPCVYIPKQMTPEEMINGYFEILENIYSRRSYLSRLFRSPARFSFGSMATFHLNAQIAHSIAPQKERVNRYKNYLRSINPQTLTSKYLSD